jgi:ABC-type transport system substrate-binding protein
VTGGPGPLIRDLVGEDFVNNTIQYGVNSKPDKAKQAMENAGYTLQDGNWVGPDGDEIDLEFISRSSSEDALIGNTVSGILNSFGIGNQLLTLEQTSFGNQVNETYEFDLELNVSVARGPAKGPFFDVHHPIEGLPETAATSDPEVCDKQPDPDDRETFAGPTGYEEGEGGFKGWAPPHRIPANPFPPYPGLDNLGSTMELPQVYDGEGEEFDPHQTALNLRLDFPEEYLLRKAREYAWWYNYNAFHAYMFTFSRSQWMDTANFKIRDGATLRGAGTGHNPVNWGDVLTK